MRRTTRIFQLFFATALLTGLVGYLVHGSVLQAPSSGSWAPTPGAMAEARSGAAAALLADGRVLVSGGEGAAGAVASAEAFNPDGSFSPVASMAFPRSRHVSVALKDGRVLVAGGVTADSSATNSAEIYDPTSDAWQAAGAMLEGRAGATATLLQDGHVLIAGGENSGAASQTLEVFDPVSDSFLPAGVMSSARKDHAATLLGDGRVLVIGGSTGDAVLGSSEVWDPASGQNVAGPAMSVPRQGFSATTLIDGTVLLAGGNDGTQDLASAELFDPAAGTLSPACAMSAPRSGHLAFLLPHNNSVLLVGGGAAAGASAELYMSWTGSFVATGSMAAARAQAAASPAGADGLLLITGGKDPAGAGLNSGEVYGFATLKTDKDDYQPGDFVIMTGSGWEPGDSVNLTLHETGIPDPDPDIILTVTADSNGSIVENTFQADPHDLGVRFYLTAVGTRSQAQTTFTDASKIDSVVVGPQSPAGIAPGSSATFLISFTSHGGGALPVTLNISSWSGGVPTGVSACSTSPSPCYSPNAVDVTLTSTLTITTTASTPPGTYTFTVQAAVADATKTATGTLAVSGPASKLAFTTSPSDSTAGAAFATQAVVTLQDASGITVTGTAQNVTLAIQNNAGPGGLLSGATTVAVNTTTGRATFSGLSIDKAGTGYTLTATGSTVSTTPGVVVSSAFNISAGTATKFVITGSGSQIAGTTNNLTITATDASGNTDPTYTANHTLTFSGANPSTNPATNPTVTRNTGQAIDFGTGTPISFASGVATVSGGANGAMTLYKAETAVIHVVEGLISSSGGGDLSVVVSAASLGEFAFAVSSPQTNGVAFTGTNTLTALDSWGNTVTAFDASANNVTVTRNAPLTGTVSGLGSLANNVLNQAGNFTSGVANLTGLMKYTGNANTGTFTATSGTGKTGTSGNVTINAGTADRVRVETAANGSGSVLGPANVPAGTSVTGYAIERDASNNFVANVAAAWSLIKTGGVVDGDLVPNVVDSKSAVFTGHGLGTAQIHAVTTVGSFPGDSGVLTVVVGAPSQLVFGQQPTNTQAGSSIFPAVTVRMLDAGGNFVATDNGTPILISIQTNPAGGTLIGDTNVKTINGVSTFSDLSIYNVGNGYQLKAHDGSGVSDAISGLFNITPATVDTTTAVTSSSPSNTSTYGDTVTFTAAVHAVSGSNAPTGTVTFTIDGTPGGPLALGPCDPPVAATACASTSTSTLSHTGSPHAVTAQYNHDSGAFNDSSGGPLSQTVDAKPLTVTGILANNKEYDGNDTATLSFGGATLNGVVGTDDVSLDTSGYSAHFNNENVGDDKPVTVSGLALSGPDAGNYTLTQPTGLKANITPKNLTVTDITVNTKQYDGDDTATLDFTSAALVGVIGGDTVTLDTSGYAAHFNNKNAGSSKPVTVTDLALSGADAGNYTLTQPAGLTGEISKRPITVTAVHDSRVYDGTTDSAGVPTITTGSLAPGDTVTWTQTFDTKHVGINKTLTPAGTVSDGNGGNNYDVHFVNDTTGEITQRPITVTAVTDTKFYDGNTSSAGVPTITLGTLATGDTVTWSQTFNNANAGTGKTLIPAGTVNDGNGGNNYDVHFVNDVTGVITPAHTSTAVISSLNPSVYGQSVTFTATVSNTSTSPIPTGQVQFKIDGVNFGAAVSLAGGSAMSGAISTITVLGSPHSVTAEYTNLDGNFDSGSGSLVVGQTVTKASTTTLITSDTPDPSIVGQPYTVNWTVTPQYSGTPTGTVNVSDGTDSCSAAVGAGFCSLTSTTVGAKTLTATYSGDPNFIGSSDIEAHSVHYNFIGFLAPIDNLPVINSVNAGRTIPVKWQLKDFNGNLISDLSTMVAMGSVAIACDAAPTDIIEETLDSPGATVFRFDGMQFIFNWQTTKSWRGCRALQLKLKDGTFQYAKFNFR